MSKVSTHLILLALFCVLTGCASSKTAGDDVIFLVVGAGGNGPSYADLANGLGDGGCAQSVQVQTWGMPVFLFAVNFQTPGIHTKAEADFAKRIEKWVRAHPAGNVRIVTHSAGGGVALGAIPQLPEDVKVDRVVLLVPSVSPTYDLAPALARINRIDVFHSTEDNVFLSWRTGTFGTYDNIKTKAAGNLGFDLSQLPEDLRAKVEQHPYEDQWKELGNGGGHFGTLAREFAKVHVAPLLKLDAPPQ